VHSLRAEPENQPDAIPIVYTVKPKQSDFKVVGVNFLCTLFGLSRRTSLTRPNGVNTSYGYDTLSRLLSVLHQSGANTLDGASYSTEDRSVAVSARPEVTF
jgi:YD repeat-containing protein